MSQEITIRSHWQSVQTRVQAAAKRVGRNPSEITVVAVTKTVGVDAVREAIQAGATDMGENRIQEAKTKIDALAGASAVWHLIGHLQTNKARDAVKYFSLIHSVDRMDLAKKISEEGGKQGKTAAVLLQVNVAKESTKGGFTVEEIPTALEEMLRLPHLAVRGLMTIAPLVENSESVRPVFRQLKSVFDSLKTVSTDPLSLTSNDFSCLSMGMSNDFEIAVEEGATLLRIGTAIFGERA